MLVPAWHHGSEVEAVRRTGAGCAFYDVDEFLAPRLGSLEALLTDDVVGLHLSHFLGFPQDAPRWRRWCDDRGLILVEDAAQAWLAALAGVPVGSHGDLAVWCLYKTVGVPDGAAVLCTRDLPALRPGGSGVAGTLRRHAAWWSQVVPAPANDHDDHAYDAARDMALDEASRASGASERLAPALASPWVVAQRRANYSRWARALGRAVLQPFEQLPEGAVPLVVPVVVDDKPAVLRELRAVGVHALDVWREPHPLAADDSWPYASWLRQHLVGLPVHQELRQRRLDHAIEDVTRLLGRRPPPQFTHP